jgi:ADP-heptose:LPS heptosyltransferase
MQSALDRLPYGSRVAIIRLRSLGDCVLTTPAIEILKRSRPDLRIGVCVEPRFAGVFEGNPDICEILAPSASAMVRWRPKLTLNLHGGTRSMMLTVASAAGTRAGFAHHRAAAAYNVRIPRAQQILGVERKVHTAEHLASAMFYLGAERRPIPRAKLFAPRRPAQKPYMVIHPFAALTEKTWNAEGFLEVADHVGLQPIFIGGPADDMTPFRRFHTIAGAPLTETKSLLQDASLFVGNDSGPAHMAAAFGVPVIVLFGPSDPVVWAPWKTESQVLTSEGSIHNIQTHDVLAAAGKLSVAR